MLDFVSFHTASFSNSALPDNNFPPIVGATLRRYAAPGANLRWWGTCIYMKSQLQQLTSAFTFLFSPSSYTKVGRLSQGHALRVGNAPHWPTAETPSSRDQPSAAEVGRAVSRAGANREIGTGWGKGEGGPNNSWCVPVRWEMGNVLDISG